MFSSKQLSIMFWMTFIATCQFSKILGELEITPLPDSYCQVEAVNKLDSQSTLTIYGDVSWLCDLHINPVSSSQILLSVVAGNITSTDYMYVERMEQLDMCSNRYVAFMELLQQPCKANFGNAVIQLHFHGDIAVGIHNVMIEDHPFGCPEDVTHEDMVGALGGQPSDCKQVKGFGSVIKCVRTNHQWWVFHETWWQWDSKPTSRCDVQCPNNCSCMLTDRQVLSNCLHDIQDLGKTFSGFVLFPSDISCLDLSNNGISALTMETFMSIGKDIRYFDLSFNFLTTLPSGSLDYLFNIIYLDFSYNSLIMLDSELFVNLHSLNSLFLQFNALVKLDVGMFANLHSLTYLSLSSNSLATLHAGVFAKLHKLTVLYLYNNALLTLDAGVFANLHSLTHLYLYKNSLVTLHTGVFANLQKLTILSLYSNSLVTLDAGVFANLYNLTHLYLNNNSLVTLDVGLFANLRSLIRLDLDSNALVTLGVGVFADLHSLAHLYLYKNSLVTIHADVFANLHSLTRLSLSSNALVTLHEGLFANLHSLTGLYLHGNSLVTLDVGVFANLYSLTWLTLNSNALVVLCAGVFPNLHKLTYLSLLDNALVTLDAGVFADLYNLTHLYLNNNSLVTLGVGVFANLSSLIQLDLDSNALVTLDAGVFADLYNLTHLFLNNNSLVTLEVGVFANLHSLAHLDLDSNSLVKLDVGVFADLYNLGYLDLEHNALVALQMHVFVTLHKLHDLYLIGNKLVALNHRTFHELVELQNLYINNNRISHLEDGTFSNLFLLERLSIAFNQLTFLPFNIFEDLHSLIQLDLSGNRLLTIPQIGHMTFLNKIDLFGNPLAKVTKNVFPRVRYNVTIFVDQPEICICYLNGSDTCFNTIKPSPYLTCSQLLSLTALTVFIWIIGCSAILGNVFVVWWKRFKQRAENKVQSLLLSNLAMSDLLMGIYMIIIASADVYYGQYFPMNAEHWRSSVLCRIAGTLAITSSEASVLFVTFISIDRFITIKFPYSIHKLRVRSTRLISAMVWAFSLTLGLTASILAGKNSDFYDNSHVCIGLPLAQVIYPKIQRVNAANIEFWKDAKSIEVIESFEQSPGLYFSVAVFIAFNMFCFLLILACYIGLIRAVSKTSSEAFRQRKMAEEIRMTLKVSAIVLTDFLCWFPICLMGALVQIGLIELPNSVFAWVVTFVLPVNSAINPFLYTIATVITNRWERRTCDPGHIQMQIQQRGVQSTKDIPESQSERK